MKIINIVGFSVLVIAIAACAGVKGAKSVSSFITADESGNTLTRIYQDGTRKTISVPIAPHNVQISADGKWVLATGMNMGKEHSSHKMSGTLLLIKANSFNLESLRTISIGKHLAHVVTDAAGKIAYITDSVSDAVIVVDIESGKVKEQVHVGAFPHGMRLNTVLKELYTANVNDGTISIVDTLKNKENYRILVGGKPIQVAVSPDGNKLYVTLAKDNAVAVVDIPTHRKVRTIAVGNAPAQIYADPMGRYMYVANQGSKSNPGHVISIIDIKSDNVIKTVRVGNMPHGIVASDDGKFVYITNMADNTVSRMDVSNFTILNSYAVGKLPNGITFIEGQD